jgi:F-type H+-transporting ATPase subunit delta
MESYVIADRYAEALSQVVPQDQWDRVLEELSSFYSVLKEYSDLETFLTTPIVSHDAKITILKKVLDCANFIPELNSFFHILVEKDRIVILKYIITGFKTLVQDVRKMETAYIRCSKQMTEEEILQVVEKLGSLTKRKLRAEVTHDPQLLCGLVARVGHVIYDLSFKTKLNTLLTQLHK